MEVECFEVLDKRRLCKNDHSLTRDVRVTIEYKCFQLGHPVALGDEDKRVIGYLIVG